MTEERSEYAVTTVNPAAVMPAIDMRMAVDRRNQMVQFVKQIMVDGTDYGVVPGTGGKPTLYKPGAEKLSTFFGLTKRFAIVDRVEDWDKPFFYYLYRCSLYRGDLLIAEADGSCNSHESKYRYRQAERVCPNCGKPSIIKGKQEYGGGWVCFAKKGGCGSKFKAGDQTIEGQQVGRTENGDVADQTNTILKMAQKRALVAATLLAVNASEFFTQDLEDRVDLETGEIVDVTATPQPAETKSRTNGGMKPETPTANGQPPEPEKLNRQQKHQAFFRHVRSTIPYYRSDTHVADTLQSLGVKAYTGDNDAELYAMLQEHAQQRANEAAMNEANHAA